MRSTFDIAKELVSVNPADSYPVLKAPPYYPMLKGGQASDCLCLAVKSMQRHTTDEGYQLQEALGENGYQLWGHGYERDYTNVERILVSYPNGPQTLVLQDKREWDVSPANFRDPRAKFTHFQCLQNRDDIFKLTVLKDAHNSPTYHSDSAREIGCHAWITYYHPRIVKTLAPYVREEHLIRTYHSLDPSTIPALTFRPDQRRGALLSGAVSSAYPWRQSLAKTYHSLPQVDYLQHPGYQASGCYTPKYLGLLSQFKVAICTSSRFGYLLRKIIEATACGCVVITDLPIDDVVPGIDDNLIRVSPLISNADLSRILLQAYDEYNPDRQKVFSNRARTVFNYRNLGRILSEDIETLRTTYNASTTS